MKGFSNLLMIVSAFVVAPFLVYFIHRFIPSAYPWVPFAIVILLVSAWVRSSFIVANGYFGWFFFGGVYPFHSMNPPPTE